MLMYNPLRPRRRVCLPSRILVSAGTQSFMKKAGLPQIGLSNMVARAGQHYRNIFLKKNVLWWVRQNSLLWVCSCWVRASIHLAQMLKKKTCCRVFYQVKITGVRAFQSPIPVQILLVCKPPRCAMGTIILSMAVKFGQRMVTMPIKYSVCSALKRLNALNRALASFYSILTSRAFR